MPALEPGDAVVTVTPGCCRWYACAQLFARGRSRPLPDSEVFPVLPCSPRSRGGAARPAGAVVAASAATPMYSAAAFATEPSSPRHREWLLTGAGLMPINRIKSNSAVSTATAAWDCGSDVHLLDH